MPFSAVVFARGIAVGIHTHEFESVCDALKWSESLALETWLQLGCTPSVLDLELTEESGGVLFSRAVFGEAGMTMSIE